MKLCINSRKSTSVPSLLLKYTNPSISRKGMELAKKFKTIYFETTVKNAKEVTSIFIKSLQMVQWPSKDFLKLLKKEMKKESEEKKKEQKAFAKVWKKAFQSFQMEEKRALHAEPFLRPRSKTSAPEETKTANKPKEVKTPPVSPPLSPSISSSSPLSLSSSAPIPKETTHSSATRSVSSNELQKAISDPKKETFPPSQVPKSPREIHSPSDPALGSPPPWAVKLKNSNAGKASQVEEELKRKEEEVLALQMKVKSMELEMQKIDLQQREAHLLALQEKRNLQVLKNEKMKEEEREEEVKKRDQEIKLLKQQLLSQEEKMKKFANEQSAPNVPPTPSGLSQSQPSVGSVESTLPKTTSYTPFRRPPPNQSSPDAPPLPSRPLSVVNLKNPYGGLPPATKNKEVVKWTVEEVGRWLESVGLQFLKPVFASHQISGTALLALTEEDIKGELKIDLETSQTLWARLTVLREGQKSEAAAKIQRNFRKHSLRVKQKTGGPTPSSRLFPNNNTPPKGPPQWDISWKDLKIETKIGEGAFGVVFKGSYAGERVAIKELKTQQLETSVMKEFLLEASIMKRLAETPHENIVRILGICTEPPHLCIVTEFYPLGALVDRLSVAQSLPSLLSLSRDIAKGLQFLHQKGIIHRDLAARNCLLFHSQSEIIAKITDFGMSRFNIAPVNMTVTNNFALKWTSPESFLRFEYQPSSDVWSWGVTVVELLNQGDPYPGMPDQDVAMSVRMGKLHPKIVPTCPRELAKLLLECWAFDPSQRPTATQIVQRMAQMNP